MKTIATVIAAIALALGASSKAEAREYRGDSYRSSYYVSGRASCGTPIYTERFFIRVDRHGHPVWGYRQMPVSYHRSRGGYDRGYYADRGGYGRECRDDRYDRGYGRGASYRDYGDSRRYEGRRVYR